MNAAAFEPAWVGQIELDEPVGDVAAPTGPSGAPYRRAHLLVRVHGTPLGFATLPLEDGGCPAGEVVGHVHAQVGGALAAHLRADGLPPAELGPGGIPPADRPPCTAPGPYPERAAGLTSVIICTRDRPERLVTAVRSVLDSDRGDLEVVVVDNAPATAPARAAVDGLGDPRVSYVLEPRPGLSRARNSGAAQASGVLLAFTDDDVRVDRSWLSRLINGFTRDAHVGCATGVVLAAELETPAQAYIEERLDWSAFGEPQLFDMAAHRRDDPMYPFSAGRFGTGANFAVNRDTWSALGGLDPLLGTGTPAMGGEDLDFFLRVVLAGRALAAEPSAIVWHWHHRTMDQLRRQQRGYGAGMAAYACKHLLDRRTGPAIARRAPSALLRMRRDTRSANTATTDDELSGVELRGLVAGAREYLLSRGRARREGARR